MTDLSKLRQAVAAERAAFAEVANQRAAMRAEYSAKFAAWSKSTNPAERNALRARLDELKALDAQLTPPLKAAARALREEAAKATAAKVAEMKPDVAARVAGKSRRQANPADVAELDAAALQAVRDINAELKGR